jgi:hypothetical protein
MSNVDELPPIPIPQDAPASVKIAFQQVQSALQFTHKTATAAATAAAKSPSSSSSDLKALEQAVSGLATEVAALQNTSPLLYSFLFMGA